MKTLIELAHRHGLITLLLLVWGLALVTWVVVYTFTQTPDIPTTTAGLVGSILSIPALVIGVYQWRMGKQKKEGDP